MRSRLAFALCSAVLVLSTACSQADQERAHKKVEEAREKTRREADRLQADARKLGHEAKQQARSLSQNFDQAVNTRSSRLAGRDGSGSRKDGTWRP